MANNDQPGPSASHRVIEALNESRRRLEAQQYARTEPIAVIGVGCRFPGGVGGPDALWRLLRESADAVTTVPADRWDAASTYHPAPATPGKMYCCRAGFLDDVDRFDADFFGIAPREAASMDPQHRLLLEVAWEALENAGVAPDTLRGARTGVYVGICQNDYGRVELNSGDLRSISAYSGTGNLYSFAPGRLAYVLGLRGPTMAVDAACSSSLVAVHLACSALRNREADLALAGGVHLVLAPEMGVFLSMARALAPDGVSKIFDAAADGFTRGEGCGVVALKRLSDAQADGDRILAVVRGSAVNHNGASSGLTVPSEDAQVEVIRRALQSARVAPGAVSFVEAHGTGTALGDPIELQALATVLCQDRPADSPLMIGSVKANVGHLEGAAGVIGLIKVVLMIQHGWVTPQLHFRTPNPRFDWAGTPIEVPTRPRPWPAAGGRIAGVSSFGMSGVNAHVVVAADPGRNGTGPFGPPARRAPERHVLVLSAKTTEALSALIDAFASHLASDPALDLGDVCFTASTGRAALRHRIAVLASSTADACRKLRASRASERVEGVFFGQAESGGDAPADAGRTGADPEDLGRAFVRGGRVDWRAFYGDGGYRKVALPTYPFQREKYRTGGPAPNSGERQALIGDRLRLPFSTEVRFQARYTGQSPAYMEEHRVAGTVVVPAAAQLSMVLTAAEEAFGSGPCAIESAAFTRALTLARGETRIVQLVLTPVEGGVWSFVITSSPERSVDSAGPGAADDASQWVAHTTGRLHPQADGTPPIAAFDRPTDAFQDGQEFYARLRETGFELGPRFRWIEGLWRSPDRAVSRMRRLELVDRRYDPRIDPGFLDACFQTGSLFWSAPEDESAPPLHVPFRIERLVFHRPPPAGAELTCRAARRPAAGTGAACDLALLDEAGSTYISVQGFEFRSAGAAAILRGGPERGQDGLWRTEWVERRATASAAPSERLRWMILGGATDIAGRVAEVLGGDGDTCLVVDSRSPQSDGRLRVDRSRPDDFRRLFEESGPVDCVVDLSATSADDPSQSVAACAGVVYAVQALARSGWARSPRLCLVTSGAHTILAQPTRPVVAQAPIWGLGKVVQLEHPELRCALVDLPPFREGDPEVAAVARALVDALRAAGSEDQYAIRRPGLYVPRLVRHKSPRPSPPAKKFEAEATYLITGGLGALGLMVAEWMVGHGARRLVLLGRQASSETALRAIRKWEEAGTEVRCESVDVSDEPAVRAVFGRIRSAAQPLRGVVHAAGALRDALLLRLDREGLAQAFASKIGGTWLLHELTKDLPLDFFVCFSSTASLFGSRGQGNYAAANAFLDAMSHYRQSLGLPGLSVNWGPWAEVGMAAEVSRRAGFAGWGELGLRPIEPHRGLDALGDLLSDHSPQTAVVEIDWPKFRREFLRGAAPGFFDGCPGAADPVAKTAPSAAHKPVRSALVGQLLEARPGERRAMLLVWVESRVAAVLGTAPGRVDARTGLFDAGLDSIMAIELKDDMQSAWGRPLPVTMTFDHPTIGSIVDFLLERLSEIDPAGGFGAERRPPAGGREARELAQAQGAVDLDRLLAGGGLPSEDEIVRQLVGDGSGPKGRRASS